MKPLRVILFALLAALQYMLWFSPSGIAEAWNLHKDIAQAQAVNTKLKDRNARLLATVNDLKHGNEAVEACARDQLGMIKKGEVFYQVVNNTEIK